MYIKMNINLKKSILIGAMFLSFGGSARAMSIDVTTFYFYDDSGVGGVADAAVTGTVNSSSTGALASGTDLLGIPWTATQAMANEITGSLQNWSGSTAAGSFSYDYTLSAGQIATGIYMDWGPNEDIAILAVFDCGAGTAGAVCSSVNTEGPAPLGTIMKNGPFFVGSGDYLTFAFEGSVSAVPVPATVWLFGSGIIGLIGFARHKK